MERIVICEPSHFLLLLHEYVFILFLTLRLFVYYIRIPKYT